MIIGRQDPPILDQTVKPWGTRRWFLACTSRLGTILVLSSCNWSILRNQCLDVRLFNRCSIPIVSSSFLRVYCNREQCLSSSRRSLLVRRFHMLQTRVEKSSLDAIVVHSIEIKIRESWKSYVSNLTEILRTASTLTFWGSGYRRRQISMFEHFKGRIRIEFSDRLESADPQRVSRACRVRLFGIPARRKKQWTNVRGLGA